MRLLIVSNRLPITITEKNGRLSFRQSAGGLVSGLSTYLQASKGTQEPKSEYIWVGWPCITVSENKKDGLKSKMLKTSHAYPVFITEKEMDKFYHGFCNKTIWPLFHYFSSETEYIEENWQHYQQVNEVFCEAIMQIIKPGDVVWIHDYHLMLLPNILRKKMPDLPIGFFLHIPFPTFEIFRLLPRAWRDEILKGIMGADIIGFHTHDYAQYFLRCVMRLLGVEHNLGTCIMENRIVKVDTYPMGIDFQKFNGAIKLPKVKEEYKRLEKPLKPAKIMLSIDRLDYTKGVLNRLKGYEIFLENNPQWHGKVILVMVVLPSRIRVEHYQRMKKQIDELTGKINGRFASMHWTPILYQFRFLSFQELAAIYHLSDVALITPLRDGMNLIAKEYVASRADNNGVLILSELAGASKELGDAIIINPNNTQEIAAALKESLEMPEADQMRRMQAMRARLKRYDVVKWADEFIRDLFFIRKEQKRMEIRLLGSIKEKLIAEFKKARRRLVFLDYDGTLVPFAAHPQSAMPDEKILKMLKCLSDDEKNTVVIISGRDKKTLNNWFGSINMELVAEHGAWIKKKNEEWKMIKPLRNDWKSKMMPILEMYADRLPGAFVEEKETAVVWHYRQSDPELGFIRAKELTDYLVNFTANIDIQILQGDKVIEIRSLGVNKGDAGMHWLAQDTYDIIFAIGDDWTDEDLFKSLPKTAYTIKVGLTQSHAKFNVYSHTEVRKLLEQLQ